MRYVLFNCLGTLEFCAIHIVKRNKMAKFQIHNPSSSVHWTGKKVLGIHTGKINVANGYIEIKDDQVTAGEIQIDMTSIVITDIEDGNTYNDFLAYLKNDLQFKLMGIKAN